MRTRMQEGWEKGGEVELWWRLLFHSGNSIYQIVRTSRGALCFSSSFVYWCIRIFSLSTPAERGKKAVVWRVEDVALVDIFRDICDVYNAAYSICWIFGLQGLFYLSFGYSRFICGTAMRVVLLMHFCAMMKSILCFRPDCISVWFFRCMFAFTCIAINLITYSCHHIQSQAFCFSSALSSVDVFCKFNFRLGESHNRWSCTLNETSENAKVIAQWYVVSETTPVVGGFGNVSTHSTNLVVRFIALPALHNLMDEARLLQKILTFS